MDTINSGLKTEDTATAMSRYVADAIRRAIARPAALPRHEDVQETTSCLRGFLEELLPAAEAHAGCMPPTAPDGEGARSVVDAARRVLAEGPGDGLRSAVLHMRDLGRACHELRVALPCAQCAYLKADRREAERREDTGGMRDAATRMGVHQREAHAAP
ncbi:hypothetical protein EKH77_12905 [Streptomyces luteoverticillatus]|uniref:Uncharacterized protein n=1 Tax=Streptomyces luteoverticillatus TaxID=66425 RepID=A0A3Q9FUA9_STRLT|nr:DUF6415 family natural product biosynthesis protein [Streptomyces luteoverticillatus]AZQ71990.1 hypothetical protein EKH77_12905 [Streptomyces luteoverticillatus]